MVSDSRRVVGCATRPQRRKRVGDPAAAAPSGESAATAAAAASSVPASPCQKQTKKKRRFVLRWRAPSAPSPAAMISCSSASAASAEIPPGSSGAAVAAACACSACPNAHRCRYCNGIWKAQEAGRASDLAHGVGVPKMPRRVPATADTACAFAGAAAVVGGPRLGVRPSAQRRPWCRPGK